MLRVGVVGSGLSGLLTSALLRARGDVELVRYERAGVAGGRARSPLLGGVPVNLGPRALYRGGPFERTLAGLGIRPRGFSPTTGLHALVDGGLQPLPASAPGLFRAQWIDGRDKRRSARVPARKTVGAFDVHEGESVGVWLDAHVERPRARAFVKMLLRTATYSDNERHDAALALAQTRRALTRGVTYVDGAWQSIVDALSAAPFAARIDAPAEAPAAVPAPTRAVRALDEVDADRVVVAATLDDARALVPSLAPAAPVVASCLDVVLARLPSPAHRVVLGIDQPLYASVHTSPRACSRPGAVIVHALRYGAAERQAETPAPPTGERTTPSAGQAEAPAPPGGERTTPTPAAPGGERATPSRPSAPHRPGTPPAALQPACRADSEASVGRAELERVLDLAQPGWRDLVVEARYLSRMVVASALPCGPRPFERVDARTFLVGDYVDSGALLADGVAASAVDAARAIFQREAA